MKTFNKYAFIEDLTNQLKTEIKNYGVDDMDAIETLISEQLDNEVIYYADCFDICKELNATSFDMFDIPCNDICQLAWCALYELVGEQLDRNELETLINEQVNA
jgi:hypothetical protein